MFSALRYVMCTMKTHYMNVIKIMQLVRKQCRPIIYLSILVSSIWKIDLICFQEKQSNSLLCDLKLCFILVSLSFFCRNLSFFSLSDVLGMMRDKS
jgi:hypothetical protein